MKKVAAAVCFLLFSSISIFSQPPRLAEDMFLRLDEMRRTDGCEKHFAELYYQTTIAAEQYIFSLRGRSQYLLMKFEEIFAGYFFNAVNDNLSRKKVSDAWSAYFSNAKLSEVQMKLLGANAHINGDIWQVLCNNFSREEIEIMKPAYIGFNKELDTIFENVYLEAILSSRKLKNLHSISFGLDKYYGKKILRRWRNRQLKLAELYFTNEKKFRKQEKRTKTKMKRIDRLIIHKLG